MARGASRGASAFGRDDHNWLYSPAACGVINSDPRLPLRLPCSSLAHLPTHPRPPPALATLLASPTGAQPRDCKPYSIYRNNDQIIMRSKHTDEQLAWLKGHLPKYEQKTSGATRGDAKKVCILCAVRSARDIVRFFRRRRGCRSNAARRRALVIMYPAHSRPCAPVSSAIDTRVSMCIVRARRYCIYIGRVHLQLTLVHFSLHSTAHKPTSNSGDYQRVPTASSKRRASSKR